MRLITFAYPEDLRSAHLGVLLEEMAIDLEAARDWARQHRGLPALPLPGSLFELIHAGPAGLQYVQNLINVLEGEDPLELNGAGRRVASRMADITFYPPLLRPMSIRDFYAFEEHVAAANAIRGRAVPEEWYQFPVFYFSNPNAIYGPGEVIPMPSYTQALDYELEVAAIIGRTGINIPASEAEAYIFGYTIMNDWSARDVQRQEMKVGLGPAKGKDFATSLGPCVVTPDELTGRSTGRAGVYDLKMTARVNGEIRSQGNWKDLYYSFGQMIERASADVYLLPGDVIGSGTVGSGCLLELTHGQGPWLKPGDTVELEVERLGRLQNQVGPPAGSR